jgi:hypothetical protein
MPVALQEPSTRSCGVSCKFVRQAVVPDSGYFGPFLAPMRRAPQGIRAPSMEQAVTDLVSLISQLTSARVVRA